VSLRLYRRKDEGLVPYVPSRGADWRLALKAPLWRPARRGFWSRQTGERFGVRSLSNPESRAVTVGDGVLIFGGLAVATVVVLAVLRLLGLWM
jgi:hypothetical protein